MGSIIGILKRHAVKFSHDGWMEKQDPRPAGRISWRLWMKAWIYKRLLTTCIVNSIHRFVVFYTSYVEAFIRLLPYFLAMIHWHYFYTVVKFRFYFCFCNAWTLYKETPYHVAPHTHAYLPNDPHCTTVIGDSMCLKCIWRVCRLVHFKSLKCFFGPNLILPLQEH